MLRELRYYAIKSIKVLNYYNIDIVLKHYGVIKGTDNSSAPRPKRQAVPREMAPKSRQGAKRAQQCHTSQTRLFISLLCISSRSFNSFKAQCARYLLVNIEIEIECPIANTECPITNTELVTIKKPPVPTFLLRLFFWGVL